jgi:chromate transporter
MRLLEIFFVFLRLGITSFGGPIAHLGFFRDEFVNRRKWLPDAHYSDLISLCQFLPGPTSSQVGFLIGLLRGGPLGAIAAWLAFTLPSAAIMTALALGAVHMDYTYGAIVIHGLKLVAVVIVTQALWGMTRNLAPDRIRITIALISMMIIVFTSQSLFQLAAIASGAMLGMIFFKTPPSSAHEPVHFPVSPIAGKLALILFCILLVGLSLVARSVPFADFAGKFFQSGSLVFGGGHVVLPLLEREFVAEGLINPNSFLAGYGATQAMPGPLFTFASYLGALAQTGPTGIEGALIATIAIFLPGFLLVIGVAPFWNKLRQFHSFQSAIAGANAAVVGVLGSALYHPIWNETVLNPLDFILVIVGYVLLVPWRVPSWGIVLLLPSLLLVRAAIFG